MYVNEARASDLIDAFYCCPISISFEIGLNDSSGPAYDHSIKIKWDILIKMNELRSSVYGHSKYMFCNDVTQWAIRCR